MPPIEPSKISTNTDSSKQVELKNAENKFANKSDENNKKKTSPVKTEAGKEENIIEQSLRPANLQEYIGQERLKKVLQIGIEAAIKRGDRASIGHIMLYGPPGLGKTSCAYLLAKLIGSNAHIFSAPSLDKPKDIVGVLMSLQEGDVLFIDEIQVE